MSTLLESMFKKRLVDEWSSRAMLAILVGQHHNGLLPEPLPRGLSIAHKTGTLHDTLNDVGIVFLHDEPYIIAVMTTNLPTLGVGRSFIQGVSRIAYGTLARFAGWRAANMPPSLDLPVAAAARPIGSQTLAAPDVEMWASHATTNAAAPFDALPQAPPAPQPETTPAPQM
jgi:hypothetical protein